MFFGFLYPAKGVEQLFEIADPAQDVLVIAGAAQDPGYMLRLEDAAKAHGWSPDQVRYLGFMEEAPAADLLAAADAVVLPFLAGAGDWNTSVHAALAQGTPVITTAVEPRGDDEARNLYTARIADVAEMRQALSALAGRRAPPAPMAQEWSRIAQAHLAFYRDITQPRSRNPSP
jgi:glycosyltransferase involved in cell wall biosynthesis